MTILPTVRLPDGLGVAITTGTQAEADKTQAIINARQAFVEKYCQEQGWSSFAVDLTLEQIMQIRSQEGWKNPCPT